jgi:hypothetical protein
LAFITYTVPAFVMTSNAFHLLHLLLTAIEIGPTLFTV